MNKIGTNVSGIPIYEVDKDVIFDLADLYVKVGLGETKSEVRRMIKQGAVKIDGIKISDPFAKLAFLGGRDSFVILQVPEK